LALESPDPDIKTNIKIINKEMDKCERIITDLLDYARPKTPVFQKVMLNEIIKTAISSINIPDGVIVKMNLSNQISLVLGDKLQLEHVITNLIMNAIQAMPKGGELTISTDVSDNNSVSISVSDTGVGIKEDHMSHLFEPLFSTKAKGIGLGLVIVKSIIESHNGTIKVISEEGKGSTFSVCLPASEGIL
jgi:signal transduction histidine kinase